MNSHPDPLRVIHEEDTVRIIEPTGKTSVTIHTAIKEDKRPFRVQFFRSTQEIKEERRELEEEMRELEEQEAMGDEDSMDDA